MMEKLASIDESKDEIELLRRLEGELQRDDEGIVDLGQYGSLCKGMCDLRSGDDVCLADGLQSIDSMSVTLPVRTTLDED